jgi:hypothetical protein
MLEGDAVASFLDTFCSTSPGRHRRSTLDEIHLLGATSLCCPTQSSTTRRDRRQSFKVWQNPAPCKVSTLGIMPLRSGGPQGKLVERSSAVSGVAVCATPTFRSWFDQLIAGWCVKETQHALQKRKPPYLLRIVWLC